MRTRLRVAGSPLTRHRRASGDLLVSLSTYVEQHRLGTVWLPIDVVLDEEKALIVQPDLLFVSNERKGIVKDWIRGAPDRRTRSRSLDGLTGVRASA